MILVENASSAKYTQDYRQDSLREWNYSDVARLVEDIVILSFAKPCNYEIYKLSTCTDQGCSTVLNQHPSGKYSDFTLLRPPATTKLRISSMCMYIKKRLSEYHVLPSR